jgi:hypothetical protein
VRANRELRFCGLASSSYLQKGQYRTVLFEIRDDIIIRRILLCFWTSSMCSSSYDTCCTRYVRIKFCDYFRTSYLLVVPHKHVHPL